MTRANVNFKGYVTTQQRYVCQCGHASRSHRRPGAPPYPRRCIKCRCPSFRQRTLASPREGFLAPGWGTMETERRRAERRADLEEEYEGAKAATPAPIQPATPSPADRWRALAAKLEAAWPLAQARGAVRRGPGMSLMAPSVTARMVERPHGLELQVGDRGVVLGESATLKQIAAALVAAQRFEVRAAKTTAKAIARHQARAARLSAKPSRRFEPSQSLS